MKKIQLIMILAGALITYACNTQSQKAAVTGVSAPVQASQQQKPPVAAAGEDTTSFRNLPELKEAYIEAAPLDRDDDIPVGELGVDGGGKVMMLKLAKEIGADNSDKFDSFLIAHKGKLLFESYYARGRINLPHPQASATKAYTSLALGRAIQLGYLTMADLDKPIASFLRELNPDKFAAGAETITLHQALTMCSGININGSQWERFHQTPALYQGQAQVQAFFEHTEPVSPATQTFHYKDDPRLVMQVIEALVPGGAQKFIKTELLDKLGIDTYYWPADGLNGLPNSGSGTGMTARNMLKWGTLTMNKGQWKGEQLVPEAFINRATSRILLTGDDDVYGGGKDVSNQGYGYYFWSGDLSVGDQTYFCTSAQGGGGQYIILIEALDLMVVVTAHENDNSTLQMIAERVLPAFVE